MTAEFPVVPEESGQRVGTVEAPAKGGSAASADARPADTKPTDTKQAGPKSGGTKTADAKPDAPASAIDPSKADAE